MREIVSVQIGQCGIQMGSAFWETISAEHGVDPEGVFKGTSPAQLQSIDVYFDEGADYSRFVPRSVFVDTDTAACDTVAAGPLGKLFFPDNYVKSSGGTGNNYAKGYRTIGAEVMENAMDVLRAEAEACDRLQGFQFMHSLGGGTGSGLGSLLLEHLNQEYPDRIMATYCVVPSPKTSDTVVEPYNTMLAFKTLVENTGLTYVLDNEALYNIATKTLRLAKPTYKDLNGLIANTMSGTTCSLRFPGQLNCDLRKLSVNMVPFPRLHFFTVGFSPLYSPNSTHYRKLTVPIITKQAFDPRNQMNASDPRKGKYLTCACMYRGKLSMHEVEQQLLDHQNKLRKSFVDWLPDHVMASVCDIPPEGLKASATFVGNTTAVTSVWMRVSEQFSAMYKKKAFLHWYTNEGMEEGDFTEAEINVQDLIAEYQQAEAVAATRDEHDDDDGGEQHDEGKEEEEKSAADMDGSHDGMFGDLRSPKNFASSSSGMAASSSSSRSNKKTLTGAGNLTSSSSKAERTGAGGNKNKGSAWDFKTVKIINK